MADSLISHDKQIVSQSDARYLGVPWYFSGEACRNGHLSPRRADTRRCIACLAVNNAKWRERNPEKVRASCRAWTDKNPDKVAAFNAKWRAKSGIYLSLKRAERYRNNKQKENAQAGAWRVRNINKCRVKSRNNKALRRGATGWHTAEEVEFLHVKQDGLCAYCSTPLGGVYHEDHIQAVSKGGSNWIENIALACGPCNLSKKDADAASFLARRGQARANDAS